MNYVTVVVDLGRVAKELVTQGHFDSANVSARQVIPCSLR